MDSVVKFTEKHQVIIFTILAILIVYFTFFHNKKDGFTTGEETISGGKKIQGIPITKTTSEGEVIHAIAHVTIPTNIGEKPKIISVSPVVPSKEATMTIKPVAVSEESVLVKPILTVGSSVAVKKVIAEESEPWPCSKASISPYDTQTIQGYEDDTSLYVPCSMNYDYPQIYQYRVLKKQNYDTRKELSKAYNYEKYNPQMSVDGFAEWKDI